MKDIIENTKLYIKLKANIEGEGSEIIHEN